MKMAHVNNNQNDDDYMRSKHFFFLWWGTPETMQKWEINNGRKERKMTLVNTTKPSKEEHGRKYSTFFCFFFIETFFC